MDEMKGLPEDARRKAMAFANSESGRQLLRELQRSHGTMLQNALNQASQGNYEAVKKTLSTLMEDPETRKLFESMGK